MSLRFSDVITISDPKSHTTPVPTNWSLRFYVPAVHILLFSMHHDFVPISCSVRITISCQFHVQHASRFRTKLCTFSCQALNHIFVLAQTCPNSDVTKAMDHNRSYTKCHLQPYKDFLQMTCNCGTPLIHIPHA